MKLMWMKLNSSRNLHVHAAQNVTDISIFLILLKQNKERLVRKQLFIATVVSETGSDLSHRSTVDLNVTINGSKFNHQ